MEAKIQKDGDVLVIYLKGQLDYETATPFRLTCLDHLVKEKVVFNMADLSFVGSKGITDFTETMVALSQQTRQAVRFCRVSTEFRRILEASNLKDLQIFDDEYSAKLSFYRPATAYAPPSVVSSSFEVEDELS